jgi:hypothetical protein
MWERNWCGHGLIDFEEELTCYQDMNRRLETEMADKRLHFVACYREREPENGCHYFNLITLLQTLVFM